MLSQNIQDQTNLTFDFFDNSGQITVKINDTILQIVRQVPLLRSSQTGALTP